MIYSSARQTEAPLTVGFKVQETYSEPKASGIIEDAVPPSTSVRFYLSLPPARHFPVPAGPSHVVVGLLALEWLLLDYFGTLLDRWVFFYS